MFDLFLDVPHPAASKDCPAAFVIQAPSTGGNPLKDELSTANGIARVMRFAFPEHDDQVYAQKEAGRVGVLPSSSPELNLRDVYAFEHDRWGRDTVPELAGSNYCFAMQLRSGERVYGHVRRYLPHHSEALSRYDVGRRGVRALVLLTRTYGGHRFYAATLKTVEAISYEQTALRADLHPGKTPQKDFLFALHAEHAKAQSAYVPTITEESKQRNPPYYFISVSAVELGPAAQQHIPVDVNRFSVPPCILSPLYSEVDALATDSSYILPLLRSIGVFNTVRLLSAMLCERRILLVSKSPSRLAGCARGALSMLAQGLISWHHMYVPILPPGMLSHLALPRPYIAGFVASSIGSVVNRVPNIGEVFVVDVDTKSLRMLHSPSPDQAVPDLLRPSLSPVDTRDQRFASASELLGQDLQEILKTDRKVTHPSNIGGVASGTAAAAASKASTLAKAGLGKMKELRNRYRKKDPSSGPDHGQPQQSSGGLPTADTDLEAPGPQVGRIDWDIKYNLSEGFANEHAEEEARIAFTSFFVALLGDMRWYLSQQAQGTVPEFDKPKFLMSRKKYGDAEGSPMFHMLAKFVETQIMDRFAKDRVEEVRSRSLVPKDAPLFRHCIVYHRTHNIDFSVMSVRRVVRQVAQSASPNLFAIRWNQDLRNRAMSVTSNNRPDYNLPQIISKLTEDCRESSNALVDVMTVIWDRIRDSRGMQWKHSLFALQLLRELLLHGPLAAVSEATDAFDIIREMKSYSGTMRSSNNSQVRMHASHICDLVVDKAKLFSHRRIAAEMRRLAKSPRPPISKDSRLKLNLPFKTIHMLACTTVQVAPEATPPNTAVDAPLKTNSVPSKPSPVAVSVQRAQYPTTQPTAVAPTPAPSSSYANDLLSFDFSSPDSAMAGAVTTVAATPTTTSTTTSELLDIFSASASSDNIPTSQTTAISTRPESETYANTSVQPQGSLEAVGQATLAMSRMATGNSVAAVPVSATVPHQQHGTPAAAAPQRTNYPPSYPPTVNAASAPRSPYYAGPPQQQYHQAYSSQQQPLASATAATPAPPLPTSTQQAQGYHYQQQQQQQKYPTLSMFDPMAK